MSRTPARQKAPALARTLRAEHPDYAYLKQVFRYVREELDLTQPPVPTQKLPHVPTDERHPTAR